ncbi:hypothetical protein SANTM175S_08439 [Streptomyces antimycoticus]
MATVQPVGQVWEPVSRPTTVMTAVTTAAPAHAGQPRSSRCPPSAGGVPSRSPADPMVRSITTARSTIGRPAASALPTSTLESAW